jgi:hypothetical protein
VKHAAITLAVLAFLVGVTSLAGYATMTGLGAEPVETPQGIGLRQESVRSGPGGFFLWYGGRTHYGGGGLRTGK